MIVISPVVLFAGAGNPPCQAAVTGPLLSAAGSGTWIATAYGPPWDAMNGSGITATGLNLTAGQPAYEIAVDPAVIPLQSFEHVTPNPFGTRRAFLRRRHRRRDHRPPRRHLRLAGPRRPGRLGRPPASRSPPRRTPAPATSSARSRRPRRASRPRRPGGVCAQLGAAAAAHARAAGEDPPERARRRDRQRRASGREARDRGRQPADLEALHLAVAGTASR